MAAPAGVLDHTQVGVGRIAPHVPNICGQATGWDSGLTLPTSSFYPGQELLLTDGVVMVQDEFTSTWYGLHPDAQGCYEDGTWSKLGSMPSGYAPWGYASAVLPNGDVIAEGGECNENACPDSAGSETNKGALFNPTADGGAGSWTSLSPPSGTWTSIGDMPSAVLPNGRFALGNFNYGGPLASGSPASDDSVALYDPATKAWSFAGADKPDASWEEGWSLLQSGKLMTYSIDGASAINRSDAQIFNPSSGSWSSAAQSPVILISGCGTATGPINQANLGKLVLTTCKQGPLDWTLGKVGDKGTLLFLLHNYTSSTLTDVVLTDTWGTPSGSVTATVCSLSSLAAGASATCESTKTANSLDLKVKSVSSTATAQANLNGKTISSGTSSFSIPIALQSTDDLLEVGAQVVRPNGTVFAIGGSGYNAVYSPTSNSWSNTPSMNLPELESSSPSHCPFSSSSESIQQYLQVDQSAAILPDGNVLFPAGSGAHCPIHYFEFNGTSVAQVSDPNDWGSLSNDPNCSYLLVLPTGQILASEGGSQLDLYTDTTPPAAAWKPTISTVSRNIQVGASYSLTGKQLDGLTQASAYGDDEQDATNYPIVKVTNDASGDVTYGRTYNVSTGSIAPHQSGSVDFTLPSGTALGPSSLQVIANGIASKAVPISVFSEAVVPLAETSASPAAAITTSDPLAPSPCGAALLPSPCFVVAWKGASGDTLWWNEAVGAGPGGHVSWLGQHEMATGVSSSNGPSLAPMGGPVLSTTLYMAWKGAPGDSRIWYSDWTASGWASEASVPGAGTSTSPALAGTTLTCEDGAPAGPALILVWKGVGTDTRVFWAYKIGSDAWNVVGQIPGAATDSAPSVTTEDDTVIASWRVAGGQSIDQSEYEVCGLGGWSNPEVLRGGPLTNSGPATATDTAGTESYAAWEAPSTSTIWTGAFSDSLSGTTQEPLSGLKTSASPSLASGGYLANELLLAFKGRTTSDIWYAVLAALPTG